MPTKSSAELAERAKFIFKGTVQRLKEATIPDLRVTDKTATVRVDEVVQAPESFSQYAGKVITVELTDKAKKGDQAIFFTNGWLCGDSIAVKSIGHTPVEKTPLTMSGSLEDPVKVKATRELTGHVYEARVIVTGRVANVRVADEPAGPASRAAITDRPMQRKRISEHDPIWREAVIDVIDVEKGDPSGTQIVVRFPASNDVRWHRAPKFQPGQVGVFLLGAGREERATRAQAKGAKTEVVYTALTPESFQPLNKAEEIKTLIRATANKPAIQELGLIWRARMKAKARAKAKNERGLWAVVGEAGGKKGGGYKPLHGSAKAGSARISAKKAGGKKGR